MAGSFEVVAADSQEYITVDFGYTFPRPPTVSASLSVIYNYGGGDLDAATKVESVDESSAVIFAFRIASTKCSVAWIACV